MTGEELFTLKLACVVHTEDQSPAELTITSLLHHHGAVYGALVSHWCED